MAPALETHKCKLEVMILIQQLTMGHPPQEIDFWMPVLTTFNSQERTSHHQTITLMVDLIIERKVFWWTSRTMLRVRMTQLLVIPTLVEIREAILWGVQVQALLVEMNQEIIYILFLFFLLLFLLSINVLINKWLL